PRLVLEGEAHASTDCMECLIADHDLHWKDAAADWIGEPVEASVICQHRVQLEAAHEQGDGLAVGRKDPVAVLHSQPEPGLCRFLADHRPPHADAALPL